MLHMQRDAINSEFKKITFEKHSDISMGKQLWKFYTWNNQFQKEIVPVNEIKFFWNSKTETLYFWLKAKYIAV